MASGKSFHTDPRTNVCVFLFFFLLCVTHLLFSLHNHLQISLLLSACLLDLHPQACEQLAGVYFSSGRHQGGVGGYALLPFGCWCDFLFLDVLSVGVKVPTFFNCCFRLTLAFNTYDTLRTAERPNVERDGPLMCQH